MKIVAIDFETFYSTDYSLSKMTTEEYIRDPRFEVIGCSIKHDTGPALFSSARTVEKTLRETIDWDDSLVIAHNMAFDGAILGWRYGLHPKMYACTMSMAQGLGLHNTAGGVGLAKLTTWAQQRGVQIKDKGDEVVRAMGKRFADFTLQELYAYGDYCNTDTNNAYALFKYFLETMRFPLCELPVISECMRLFCDPLLNLDKTTLEEHLVGVVQRKEDLLAKSGTTLEMVRSDDTFAALLQDMGIDPPVKYSPKRKNEDGSAKVVWAFSKTDQEFLDLQEHESEEVQALVACRLGNKSTIEESRTCRFIGIESRGTMPVPLRYYAAHPGRFGGTDKINLQNLTRGGKMRDAITAPPGHLLVVSDSSQIEARMLAWMSEQEDLVASFALGNDVYSEFASGVYARPITKTDKVERFTGKTAVLGLGYGLGWAKFQATLKRGMGGIKVDMPTEQAKQTVAYYRTKYSRISGIWRQSRNAIEAMLSGGNVRLGREGVLRIEHPNSIEPFPRLVMPNGMCIRYPGLHAVDGIDDEGRPRKEYFYEQRRGKQIVQKRIYGGALTENFTQGLARIIVTDQWIQIKKRAVKERIFHRSPVVGQVHDELIAVCPEAAAEDLKALMIEEMSKAPPWAAGLPVACEAAIAYRYGDAK